MADSQQTRPATADEQFRKLFDRTAKLADQVSALLAPDWGSEVGIIPTGHPLYVGERPPNPAATEATEPHVTVYGIDVSEWDRMWEVVRRIETAVTGWRAEDHAGHGSPCEQRSDGSCAEPDTATAPAPEDAERCCVCGGRPVTYHNYREQPFCWPCADCQCGQDVCERTGINDHQRALQAITELRARAEQADAALVRVHHVAAAIHAGAPWTANCETTAARIRAAITGPELAPEQTGA
ncbi:hypothetical protein [Streptomyces sp. bgisy154]|uniref:hypothetical protein n=1 Tax=Streptomyces sp. bgisy154 TaxID=3413794 RepID=UPI003D720E94